MIRDHRFGEDGRREARPPVPDMREDGPRNGGERGTTSKMRRFSQVLTCMGACDTLDCESRTIEGSPHDALHTARDEGS